jgi:hypothetical protein
LIQALSEGQRKQAIVNFSKTGNNNLTEAFKDNVVLDYAGTRASELPSRRQQQLIELADFYIGNMQDGHAKTKMDEVKRHLDSTYFAWIGGVEAKSVFYYRIHSPVVLIEFDHQRPANLRGTGANQPTRQHIHTVVAHPTAKTTAKTCCASTICSLTAAENFSGVSVVYRIDVDIDLRDSSDGISHHVILEVLRWEFGESLADNKRLSSLIA